MNKFVAHILPLVFVLAACSHKEDPLSAGREIAMGVSVTDVALKTKAPVAKAFEGSNPSSDNSFTTDLWFSLTSGDYSTSEPSNNNYIPCHTYRTFTSSDITPILYNEDPAKTLKYPTSGENVYCVGLYPKGKWSLSGSDFTANIDGIQDLMFSKEISGKWNAQFGTSGNSPQFEHMLTWIKIVLCATSHDAIEAWGNIKQVTIKDIHNTITVSDANGSSISYTGSQDLDVMDSPTAIDILKKDVGSVLIAPASSYKMLVTTSEGVTASKDISISGGFKAGMQYVVVLYFNQLSVIDGVCTLSTWENQNDNLHLEQE